MSKNGLLPVQLEKVHPKTKIPVIGVIVSAIVGLLFLLPFPSWASLVNIVTGASVLMYAGAPLALGALRKSKPNQPRSYKLPGFKVVAPIAFILANFIVYWSGWNTVSLLMAVLLVGYLIMALSSALHLNDHMPKMDWGASVWIFPYLVGMTLISYFGNFGTGGIFGLAATSKDLIGAQGDLPFWWDMLVLAVFSVGIYLLAVRSALPEAKVDEYVQGTYVAPVLAH
jgi:amino acid transporter